MVQILPFRAEHAGQIEPVEADPVMEKIIASPAYHKWVEMLGPGYTMKIDEEIIGCLIFAKLLYPGVAEVLIRMDRNVERHKLSMHRFCRSRCDMVQEMHGLHRLEAKIAESAVRNRKWAESFGFVEEGVLEAFGPKGEDYIQYARVRRDLICHS